MYCGGERGTVVMKTLPHPSTIRDRAFFLVSVSEHRDTASFLPDRNAVSWHEPIQWNVFIVEGRGEQLSWEHFLTLPLYVTGLFSWLV